MCIQQTEFKYLIFVGWNQKNFFEHLELDEPCSKSDLELEID